MKMIETAKVVSMVRLLMFNNPNANAIMKNVQELVDRHSVDAEPVVRCKDCLHSRERNEDEKKYLIEGVRVCTSPDATDECWNPVFPEHFCSYGEEREKV